MINLLKLFRLLGLIALSLTTLQAEDKKGASEDKKSLGDDFKYNYAAEVNTSAQVSTKDSVSAALNYSFISLGAEWKEKIRAVLTAKLESLFQKNFKPNSDFTWGEFVREAYIEVREVGGKPIAILVGKRPIPFSQGILKMPIFQNSPLFKQQVIDQVFGVTVDFSEGLTEIFDRVEVVAFESASNDFSIGRIDGLSVRLSKVVFDHWLLTLSHLESGNHHLGTGHERKSSIGLVGKTRSGTLVGWTEGFYFSNNPAYPKATFALTIGAELKVHRTSEVVLEFNWVQNHVTELALGFKTALTKYLKAGTEVRVRSTVEKDGTELIIGIGLNYVLSKEAEGYNPDYLFGKKEESSKSEKESDSDGE